MRDIESIEFDAQGTQVTVVIDSFKCRRQFSCEAEKQAPFGLETTRHVALGNLWGKSKTAGSDELCQLCQVTTGAICCEELFPRVVDLVDDWWTTGGRLVDDWWTTGGRLDTPNWTQLEALRLVEERPAVRWSVRLLSGM